MTSSLPEEPRRAKRRRLAAARANNVPDEVSIDEHIVVLNPVGDVAVFTSRRKARKFERRHRREIDAAFDW